MDCARFLDHRSAQRVGPHLRGCELLEAASHALDGPEQVHSRRPRLSDCLADARKLRAEFIESASIRPLDAESDAHSGGHANRRGSANHHVFDRRGNVTVVGVGVANHFAGQAPLVKHHNAFAGPFNGLGNIHHRLRFAPPGFFRGIPQSRLTDHRGCAATRPSQQKNRGTKGCYTQDAQNSWP